MQKVLVLGAKGMLGQELVRVFSADEKYTVTGWDREDIDITDFVEAEKQIQRIEPEIILNAVAYNAVDLCETSDEEYAKAKLLNTEVPRFLAHLAKNLGAALVHYSTDYVFDGKSDSGYDEKAEPKPLSRYGETKWGGEKEVLESGGDVYMIRLSKLFGRPATSALGKRSFFDVMLEKGREGNLVKVVDDEKSCFTYAPDLAQATKELIEAEGGYGIYHLPNENAVTWYEAVQELYQQAGLTTEIVAVASDAFPRPAKRPRASVLLNTKRPRLRPYQAALKEYLER